MPSIGHQLGELFLGAAPTVLIILVFYFILRTLFFQPLLNVMAERDARTVGAPKERVAGELAAARRDVESSVAQLSAEIARRILQAPPRPGAPTREAR